MARDVSHLRELVMQQVAPAATVAPVQPKGQLMEPAGYLIVMGFPCSVSQRHQAVCACHQQLSGGGYLCPQCCSKICELPSTCRICGLALMSSAHLARSYHHLFPVVRFTGGEPTRSLGPVAHPCAGCNKLCAAELLLECPNCHTKYCYACDGFIHDNLHVCLGCEAL